MGTHKNTVAYRRSLRVEIDGRMVAAHLPDERHGEYSVYRYWLCRCVPCSEANGNRPRIPETAEEKEAVIEPMRRSVSVKLLTDQGRYLVGEYEHMRSFGMSHEAACERVGVSTTHIEKTFREGTKS